MLESIFLITNGIMQLETGEYMSWWLNNKAVEAPDHHCVAENKSHKPLSTSLSACLQSLLGLGVSGL